MLNSMTERVKETVMEESDPQRTQPGECVTECHFKRNTPRVRLMRLAAQRARDSPQPFYWHPAFHKNRWCFDAFTVDPSDQPIVALMIKGLRIRGLP